MQKKNWAWPKIRHVFLSGVAIYEYGSPLQRLRCKQRRRCRLPGIYEYIYIVFCQIENGRCYVLPSTAGGLLTLREAGRASETSSSGGARTSRAEKPGSGQRRQSWIRLTSTRTRRRMHTRCGARTFFAVFCFRLKKKKTFALYTLACACVSMA